MCVCFYFILYLNITATKTEKTLLFCFPEAWKPTYGIQIIVYLIYKTKLNFSLAIV